MVEHFTDEQVQMFKEAFMAFDKDESGKISAEDVVTAMRAVGRNPSLAEIKEIIYEVDVERTGEIAFPQFLSMLARELQFQGTDDQIEDAFRVFDKEGNGFISSAELRHVLTSMGETLNDEEVDELVRLADLNGDGQIVYSEFVKMMNGK